MKQVKQAEEQKGLWHTEAEVWSKLRPQARRMRREQTPAEACLWGLLRNGGTPARFRRQYALGRFIVDFYCARAKLVVEVDGPIYERSQQQDAYRDKELQAMGFRVFRFKNEQVLNDPQGTLNIIKTHLTS